MDTSTGQTMSFWDHLEVFRWTILRIVIVLVVMLVASFIAMPYIFDPVVLGPTRGDFFMYRLMGAGPFQADIININVASQFLTHFSFSFWVALLLVFPYLMFEIWRFVSPALYEQEKHGVRRAFLGGALLFYLGCAVGYCVVFPITFRFLAEYNLGDLITNQISLSSYTTNFLTIIFVLGVVFELPILAWLLSLLGIVNKDLLRKGRRYAVIVLLVLAAVITPTGDPFSLMVVFLPLYLLYELSIAIVPKKAPEED